MPTAVVSWTSGSPTTQYVGYMDVVSQSPSGNYSTVYTYAQAINRGNTSSFSSTAGAQQLYLAGAGAGSHSGTMPSGYATGAQRWMDGPFGYNMPHGTDGNRAADGTSQTISGWFSNSTGGSAVSYPRIPVPSTPPGTPVISLIGPTSMELDWASPTGDNGGSAVDGYLVRRWTGSSMTGAYVDAVLGNVLTYTDTGLTPGTVYTYGVYAHNGSYAAYSVVSTGATAQTLAPLHVKVGGVWKYAVPYVMVAGVWKMSTPWVKVAGVWKATG